MSTRHEGLRFLSPHPNGWSNVVEVTGGSLVFITGQQAWDESGQIVGEGDWRAQIEQAFHNLERQLRVVGATFHDVVKLTIIAHEDFTEDGNAFIYAEVLGRHIDVENPPASALTLVRKFGTPGVLIDIAAIAHLPA